MNKKIIESANAKSAQFFNAQAAFASPFYALYSLANQTAFALFWSAFGPVAQYCFSKPYYAYANA